LTTSNHCHMAGRSWTTSILPRSNCRLLQHNSA